MPRYLEITKIPKSPDVDVSTFYSNVQMISKRAAGRAGYKDALVSVQDLIDLGIITVNDVKKLGYKTND